MNFLPIDRQEASALGWDEVDFVLVSGDAYVDHPSFGAAVIGRVLVAAGYRVGMLPQPGVNGTDEFLRFGTPRLGVLVSGGVVDSMVAHYTVAKRRRRFDEYTPGGKTGKRPDRAVEVYARLAKQAFPQLPVVIGGVEASLRRFAHYDYWQDEVRPSILESSGADLISFGMGEQSIVQIADALRDGLPVEEITHVAGTAYLAEREKLPAGYVECASYEKVRADKAAYARAFSLQYNNQDPLTAKPLVQKQGALYLVQNPPSPPLGQGQLDAVYELPFSRRWHPVYDDEGGVPALEEVEFSLAHNRGCFGGCSFCAITMHQGRRVQARSADSVVREAQRIIALPGFKGYIHDVGGPTANFRMPSCQKQQAAGMCGGGKRCLGQNPCPQLQVDHSEYLALLRRLRGLPGVKKVFIRSGIRYDYLVYDKNEEFFKELVQHHVSGQLKVAPEHCSPRVLRAMGKPLISTYDRFAKRFYQLSRQAGKQQYLVPYLISSHPGSTLRDAALLAEWLHDNHVRPEQVQDFYPTPGTVSTCMYYTGVDPFSGEEIYVAQMPQEKAMQRALLQYTKPQNRQLATQALEKAGRQDLLPKLLGVRAAGGHGERQGRPAAGKPAGGKKAPGRKGAQPGAKPAGAAASRRGKTGADAPRGKNRQEGKTNRRWREEPNSRSKKKRR